MAVAEMRQTELKRKTSLNPKRTQRKCRACGTSYLPSSTTQRACSPRCALELVAKDKARRERDQQRQQRAEIRAAKEQLKTIPQLKKEAQEAFNWFIRERDHDQPCICCGRWGVDEAWKPGGQWDAGHFLSVGSHPELRFDERNCHKQLKSCNAGAGKYTRKNHTVSQEYRERLIEKVGLSVVEELEGPHDMPRWRHDDLRAIRDHYRKAARELKKRREQCSQ